jgi:WG containing repeat
MKNLILLFTVLYTIGLNVQSQKVIIPVSRDGKWGAIDKNGNWQIEPRYLSMKEFFNRIALVKSEAGWIYVNTQGTIISLNHYYLCQHNFSEGLARVQENKKWGFIDVTGNYVIEPRFEGARDFSEGLAAVEKDSKWGYIDKSGEFVIQPVLRSAWDFNCGIAIVIVNEDKAYMNRNGEILPNPDKYEVHRGFRDNYAPVRKNDLWGFINVQGNYIVKPLYEKADRFMNGLAPVKKMGKCGYINVFGEEVVPLNYNASKLFADSMALVQSDDKLYYLDIATGHLIGQDKPYIVRYYFSEGLARVSQGDKFGFINKNGELVIECKYEDAKNFSNGLAAVKINGLWGFIDNGGNLVIQPRFDGIRYADATEEEEKVL